MMINQMIRQWVRAHRTFYRFFPPACAGCDGWASPQDAFCPICKPLAYRIKAPYCALCMVPGESTASVVDAQSLCSRCYQEPPAFDSVRALWEYDGAVADAVRRIKYGEDFPALRALGRSARPWLRHQLQQLPEKIPIVCVPAHKDELRRRGFHLPSRALQVIAPKNARQFGPLLHKTRPTPRQASLPLAGRKANVLDAFQWRSRGVVAQGPVLLFDDVMTTGATASAAATALKSAGFTAVHVAVLARAPRPDAPPHRAPTPAG